MLKKGLEKFCVKMHLPPFAASPLQAGRVSAASDNEVPISWNVYLLTEQEALMARMTLNFPDYDFTWIRQNAIKKGMSRTQYVRELIALGRQMEMATAQKPVPTDALAPPASTQDKEGGKTDKDAHWKGTVLRSVLESRYLVRYLVDNLPNCPVETRNRVLTTMRNRASELAKEFA